jgi:hypothetical protein
MKNYLITSISFDIKIDIISALSDLRPKIQRPEVRRSMAGSRKSKSFSRTIQ